MWSFPLKVATDIPGYLRGWGEKPWEKTDLEFVPQEFVNNFLLFIGCLTAEMGEEPDPVVLVLGLHSNTHVHVEERDYTFQVPSIRERPPRPPLPLCPRSAISQLVQAELANSKHLENRRPWRKNSEDRRGPQDLYVRHYPARVTPRGQIQELLLCKTDVSE